MPKHSSQLFRAGFAILQARQGRLHFQVGIGRVHSGGCRVKSYLRRSKCDRSTLNKIDRAIRAGWRPGMSVADVLSRNRRRRFARLEAGAQCL
jgi:hypothetical protein